jgi:hypothetical protein
VSVGVAFAFCRSRAGSSPLSIALAFEKEWMAFLARPEYNVAQEGEHRKRREFLSGLIEIIQKHAFFGVAHGLLLTDFKEIYTDRLDADEPMSHPYAYSGRHCVKKTYEWALKELL